MPPRCSGFPLCTGKVMASILTLLSWTSGRRIPDVDREPTPEMLKANILFDFRRCTGTPRWWIPARVAQPLRAGEQDLPAAHGAERAGGRPPLGLVRSSRPTTLRRKGHAELEDPRHALLSMLRAYLRSLSEWRRPAPRPGCAPRQAVEC